MNWAVILLTVEPLLLLAGLYFLWRFLSSPKPNASNDSDDAPGSGGGGIDFDWDAPLDLPPGIVLMPEDPVREPQVS
ncbi:hypothetical protein [Pontibacter sp. G13]|uniref:hypothetical protein n=1 Tax=Pontibacter sp. G13 TaxID=3074898 RepID=UPI002889B7FF|nr:hypothetical protein [Pontibacter sp. G13]WNJ17463.1 hypothetical protein RJD25_21660 [Pontibacter sp. G13]